MKEAFKPYLVSYRHDGSEWNAEIMATSFADARDRLGKLALGRVEGVSVAKVPAAFGIFGAVAIAVRNAVAR
jgi:hypothetical protein